MTSSYVFCYLAGALFNIGLWLLFYRLRKDLRREMWTMSILPIIMGLPQEYFLWTRDWWRPPTITGTVVGLEDVLYAIGTGGVFATFYPIAFRRRLAPGSAPSRLLAVLPLAVDFALPFLLVSLAGLHSFTACAIAAALALLCIFVVRPDLIFPALVTALLAVVTSLPCYWLMEWLAPGFIAAAWDLPRLSGVFVAGVPIEDLAWYGYTAALFGVYYKYATGERIARSEARGDEMTTAEPEPSSATRGLEAGS